MPEAVRAAHPDPRAIALISAAMHASRGAACRAKHRANWCSFSIIVLGAIAAAAAGDGSWLLARCAAVGVVCAGAGRVIFDQNAESKARHADQYQRTLLGEAPR